MVDYCWNCVIDATWVTQSNLFIVLRERKRKDDNPKRKDDKPVH